MGKCVRCIIQILSWVVKFVFNQTGLILNLKNFITVFDGGKRRVGLCVAWVVMPNPPHFKSL